MAIHRTHVTATQACAHHASTNHVFSHCTPSTIDTHTAMLNVSGLLRLFAGRAQVAGRVRLA
jgi:hypothetical protein